MIRLKVWSDRADMAYIWDSNGIRNTIAIIERDKSGGCGAYIEKIVVSEEIDGLLNRFNHIRPSQDDRSFLLTELTLFLASPDCYQYSPRISDTPREVLRFLRATESTKDLQPVIIENVEDE